VLLLHFETVLLRFAPARYGLSHSLLLRAGSAAAGRVLGLHQVSRTVETTLMKKPGLIVILLMLAGGGALVTLGKMDRKTDLSAVLVLGLLLLGLLLLGASWVYTRFREQLKQLL